MTSTRAAAALPSSQVGDGTLSAGRQVFHRYLLQRVVGRGGMGVVWLARDEKLDRPVALKFLPEVFLMDAVARDDLMRETRHSLDLTHPHIVRIHDFVEDDEMAAIAMEYVDGPTLSQLRVEQPCRHFEPDALSIWTGALCAALDYAHGVGCCVHRDLKPGNLMVSSRGVLKVADFGIACRLHNTAARVSARSSTGGTLGYMSPQQLLGELAAPSDDIYSVGATLYELLTGTLPFFGGDLTVQIREVVPESVAERRRKFGLPGGPMPKAWEETIAACLAKQPQDRPGSAGEVAQRLGLTAAALGETLPDPGGGVPPTVCSAPTSVVRASKWRRTLDRLLAYGAPLKRVRWPIITAFALGAAVVPWIAGPASMLRPQTPYKRHSSRQDRKPAASEVAPPSPIPGLSDDQLALLAPIPASSRAASQALTPAVRPQVQIVSTPSSIPFKVLAGSQESPTEEELRSGETPAIVDDLPPGAYRVVFTPSGAASRTAGFQVPTQGTALFRQDFPHVLLKVRSKPDGAAVFCDGREIGTTPLEIPLLPGRHEVNARLKGLDPRGNTVQVTDATEQTLTFDFRNNPSPAKGKSHHSRKAADESLIAKVGQSLKTFFTGDTARKR